MKVNWRRIAGMVIALLVTACLGTTSAQQNTWLCQRDGYGSPGAAGTTTSKGTFWSITRWNGPDNPTSHNDARAEGYVDNHTLATCQKDQNDDGAGRIGAGCFSDDWIEAPYPAQARSVGDFITAQFGWHIGRSKHFVIDVDYGWYNLCPNFYSTGIAFEVPPPPSCTSCGSPILIPLGNSPSFELSDVAAGVVFDIDGDGDLDQVAWPLDPGNVAFLAYDRNGDGAITSGYELFGNHTVPGRDNGFSALGTFVNRERNSAWVSSTDEVFSKLLLWTDVNRDGVSQPEELQSAGNVISAISLQYRVVGKKDRHGNEFRFHGAVKFVDQEGQRPIYDVVFLTQFAQ